jgi:hypothetical protein
MLALYWGSSNAVGFASWTGGVVVAALIALRWPFGVTHSPESGLFVIPGSWLPMILMLALFFMKMATSVLAVRHPALAAKPEYIASISFLYGVWSGVFCGRALHALTTSRTAPAGGGTERS